MAKTMEHLSDILFVTVANSTLARRDAYLSHLKAGIKPDTLAALRTAPLQMTTLFPGEVLKQAEQDIATFASKNQPLSTKKGCFHPYERMEKRSDNRKPERPAWKILDTVVKARMAGAGPHTTLHDRPRGSSHTNDNQCVISPIQGMLPTSLKTVKCVHFTQSPTCTRKTVNFQTQDSLSVSLNAVGHVLFVKGLLQKKDVSPVIVPTYIEKLKYVKNVSCVDPLSFASTVQNAKHVAQNLPVGARFQNFWQTWLDLGVTK